MNKILVLIITAALFLSCKDEAKEASKVNPETEVVAAAEETLEMTEETSEVEAEKKSIRQLKKELTEKGYKTFDYVDKSTQDTILMQQYFMAFLKAGPIRGQNEEESAHLQEQHLEHLQKMYDLGYADISGPFGDDGDIRGVTIYNVPTLKMADSLANADPMVKAGRLQIEIHPWWAAKGYPLR